ARHRADRLVLRRELVRVVRARARLGLEREHHALAALVLEARERARGRDERVRARLALPRRARRREEAGVRADREVLSGPRRAARLPQAHGEARDVERELEARALLPARLEHARLQPRTVEVAVRKRVERERIEAVRRAEFAELVEQPRLR